MLLSRYGNIEYVFSLSLSRASKLFNKAVEEKKIDKAYQRWIVREPHYTQENYQTFKEFFEMIYPPKVSIDTRSKDEIMNELLGKEG